MVCCFGCISLIANYVVFMTFFHAAALALFLEVRERDEPNYLCSIVSVVDLCLQVCPDNPENMTWHIDELARGLQEED